MTALVAIVLGAACAFLVYALVQFGREIRLLRSQRNLGAALLLAFRGMPESAVHSDPRAKSKVTVLPVGGMANRDVA
jgi:uncharacterized protein involved in response to NO